MRPTWGGGELIVAAFMAEEMATYFVAAEPHRINDRVRKANITINPPNAESSHRDT